MTLRVVAAVVTLAVTSAMAQQPDPQPLKVEIVNLRQAAEVPEPPEPPPGANAWSLRIHTSGGFTGQGVGSVTISSDGQMACGPAPCATPVATTLVEPFGKAIATAVVDAVWSGQPLSTVCSDCIRTTIAVKRRDGDVVRVYRASWDDTQSVTPELRELRRLALELRAARAGR